MRRTVWLWVRGLAAVFVVYVLLALLLSGFSDAEAGRGGGTPIYGLIALAFGGIIFAGASAKLVRDPGECERCGYDLSGLPAEAVCPECGAERPPADTDPDA